MARTHHFETMMVFGVAADPLVTRNAACQGADPALFFGQYVRQTNKAKAICHRCPVRDRCLAEAMACGDRLTGVWGGTTQREREKALNVTRSPAGRLLGGSNKQK